MQKPAHIYQPNHARKLSPQYMLLHQHALLDNKLFSTQYASPQYLLPRTMYGTMQRLRRLTILYEILTGGLH